MGGVEDVQDAEDSGLDARRRSRRVRPWTTCC